ncbi:MAG: chromate transporter [Spirochaetales bacterium]|nr:chromate transporter [Spirochaetales bacterium]
MSEEKPVKKTSLASLFLAFAKIGVMTFGGGYAMLPMLEREVVDNHGWTTSEQMMDYYAVGQCTPGVIAVNVSTFVGFNERGVIGAIAAMLGVVFPSLVIIMSLASVLMVFRENVYVARAFAGIRIAVCALILSAVIKLAKKAISNIPTAVIAVLAFLLQVFLGISPVIIVLTTAAGGIAVYFIKKGKKPEEGGEEEK